MPPSPQDADTVVGNLSWVIEDTATKAVLSQGATSLRVRDIQVVDESEPGEPSYSKTIRLNEHFSFNMAGFPEATRGDVTGFGMTVDRNDMMTFCWEWFEVDGQEHATKLQETGELRIKVAKVGQGWEVVATEFLTDVSFRVLRFGKDDPGGPPTWRVLIRKGSVIRWPSIVEGKLVVN